ncbi:hypothetical protein L249_7079 [Ophiocordyceps polyrhachis-furcata BCC 54312]|uniref:Uncharacterized protein n=1 Tax=Ophiocordyceps polyrhachis-furcata BCC 54312 TaxID=1330021 RepID=A0A367LK46_9HYPO|nr:hypothetical protein L249_7079 [Ophiocordyceps polyrhachis-furcata BCC 54312]
MHDLGLRAQSPLNVGKVESNEVFCRAVEEEEGSKKLVESLLFAAVEMMMSNQGVDYVIEKKKTNYVIVVFIMTWLYVTPFHFNVMDQPDDLTLRVDRLQRADRCDGCLPHCDSGRCGGP